MQNPFPGITLPASHVLGYRRDGRPIYPIAGGSGEGGDGGGITPPAAPPAPPAPPAAGGQDPQGDGSQFQGQFDPDRAARLIDNLRSDLATEKQKRADAEGAQQSQYGELVNALKAAGIQVGDTPDPATLQASLTAAQDQARTAQLRAVLYETAGEHGANPTALRDSLSFLESVKGLDPTDTAAVVAAAKAAVTANTSLAAAPAGPPRGPADLSGSGNAGPKQVTEDELTSMTPEEIVQAQTDGRLRNLLGG